MSKFVPELDVVRVTSEPSPMYLYHTPGPVVNPPHVAGASLAVARILLEVSTSPQAIVIALSQESFSGVIATPDCGIQ